MGLIGIQSVISARSQRISFAVAGPAVPDGDGGYTESWTPLNPPALFGEINPATAGDLEFLAAGTVMSQATLLATVPFHPGVTMQTRLTWTDSAGRAHTANVVGLVNVDERCRELHITCVEEIA
jgi:head-tail adaptor